MIRRIAETFDRALYVCVTCLGVGLLALAVVGTCVAGIGIAIGPGFVGLICLALSYRFKFQRRKMEQHQQQERDRVVQAIEKQRREVVEAEARRKKQHADDQDRTRRTLTTIVSGTHATIEILPSVIAQAEAALDNAEFEFAEGAFVPFWDAVEKAVANLDSYNSGIQTITSNSKRIPEEIKKLDRDRPRIDLSTLAWPVATPTIMRMRRIVRQAQKNIDFTTVYQQRRTNGILVAGFANLGSAIEDMGSRIDGSINVLTQTVDSAMSAIAEQSAELHRESLAAMEAQREQQASDAAAQLEQSASDSKARREHERKVEEMTDNIQRRKTPYRKHWRDGNY